MERLCFVESATQEYIEVQQCMGTEHVFEQCGITSANFADCTSGGCGGNCDGLMRKKSDFKYVQM